MSIFKILSIIQGSDSKHEKSARDKALLKELEAEKINLAREEARTLALIKSIGDGVLAADQNGIIMFVNDAIKQMLGTNDAKLIGHKVADVFNLKDENGKVIENKDHPIPKVLKNGKVTRDLVYISNGQSDLAVSVTSAPIILFNEVVGVVQIFHDITREKQVEKMKDEFVSIASHQLRTPLGIIRWYLEDLKDSGVIDVMDGNSRDYLEEVYKSNDRMIRLVNNLLYASRIDSGTTKDKPTKIDIIPLIKTIIKELETFAVKREVKINLAAKTDHLYIKIDESKFREIVYNLLTNGIKYNKEGGFVKVGIEVKEGYINLVITDSGIGISDEDQKKLFTKFFRSERAKLADTEGSGLGLYIAKSYIEKCNGKIKVKSAVDKGTTFLVTIPKNL